MTGHRISGSERTEETARGTSARVQRFCGENLQAARGEHQLARVVSLRHRGERKQTAVAVRRIFPRIGVMGGRTHPNPDKAGESTRRSSRYRLRRCPGPRRPGLPEKERWRLASELDRQSRIAEPARQAAKVAEGTVAHVQKGVGGEMSALFDDRA